MEVFVRFCRNGGQVAASVTKTCWCCGGTLIQESHPNRIALGKDAILWVHASWQDLLRCRQMRTDGARPGQTTNNVPPPPQTWPA